MKKDRTKANPIKAVLLRFGSYLFSDFNSKTVFFRSGATISHIEKAYAKAENAPMHSIAKL